MEEYQEAMMTTNPSGDNDERQEAELDSLRRDLLVMIGGEVSLDPNATIAPDTDLLLSGLVDSLGVVQIVGWLEDRLGVQIDPVDIVLENFESVDAIAAFVGGLTDPAA